MRTLKTMAKILGDTANIAGGKSGALQTDFPTSVSNVFSDKPKAAQVIEGDFVPGVVAGKTKLKAGTGYNVFPFPAIGDAKNVVVGGGDCGRRRDQGQPQFIENVLRGFDQFRALADQLVAPLRKR